MLTALARVFPEYVRKGVRALRGQPVFYASVESHHSLLKAARISGIGVESLREVRADADLRMDPEALAAAIEEDRGQGRLPFLIVATAGTTNAGVVDPIPALADVAERESIWLHVDAAWGGAACLVPELRGLLDGIQRADSITFDAHQWLSVPMGAGIYLTRNAQILSRTFSTPTTYMPREASRLNVVDPHLHSIQWSRRFTGLKLFLSLLVAGWEGYEKAIRHMTAMGNLLRAELAASGWRTVNNTPLPVVCFVDPGGADPEALVSDIVSAGEAWLSTTRFAGQVVMRACITNYRTGEEDVRALVESLNQARSRRKASA
jgi:glutamate/tyrosine decarboxylase-like PLP-dependent enzyme